MTTKTPRRRKRHSSTSADDWAVLFWFAILITGLLLSVAVGISLCYYLITTAN